MPPLSSPPQFSPSSNPDRHVSLGNIYRNHDRRIILGYGGEYDACVGIVREHKWFGMNHNEVQTFLPPNFRNLTYSSDLHPNGDTNPGYHWYFGFDTARIEDNDIDWGDVLNDLLILLDCIDEAAIY